MSSWHVTSDTTSSRFSRYSIEKSWAWRARLYCAIVYHLFSNYLNMTNLHCCVPLIPDFLFVAHASGSCDQLILGGAARSWAKVPSTPPPSPAHCASPAVPTAGATEDRAGCGLVRPHCLLHGGDLCTTHRKRIGERRRYIHVHIRTF